MLIAAPTCPDCGSELEHDALRDEWWCWRGRLAFSLDVDGYLQALGPRGAA